MNHANDGDLIIQLIGPGGLSNLSQRNGSGGQNYINTTFDDTASLSITQGTPPFTGTYRPQSILSILNDKPVSGYWVLRIYDAAAGNTGTLTNWCLQIETKANVGIEENIIPVKFELSQNYPNPFNSTTNIKYAISKSSNVKITVYDILGKELEVLIDEQLQAGTYQTSWNASNYSSGIYFYRMQAGDYISTMKMLMIK